MRGRIGSAVALLFFFQALHAATDAGDPKRGAQGFRACVACHAVAPGEYMTGPSLAKVWNHKAGSAEGFTRYSEPMKRLDAKWDERTLDKWLADPERFLPGTTMTFPGIKDMSPSKADLRKAPAEAQVKSIRRCNDTYTVETADGKTQKVWEFNLRFKTDSSGLGPRPGQPIAVGAGMQGDRASIAFASPKEISAAIPKRSPRRLPSPSPIAREGTYSLVPRR